MTIISFFIALAIVFIFFGFWRWYSRIQPEQDRLIEMQLEKVELEIKLLKKKISLFPEIQISSKKIVATEKLIKFRMKYLFG